MPCFIDFHWRLALSWMETKKEVGIGGRTGAVEGLGRENGRWGGRVSEAEAGM